MKVLVSACLLGCNCKYNGGNNYNPRVAEFLKDKEVIEICPEMLAGLGTPRCPAEIVNGIIMNSCGENVDEKFREGVTLALERIKRENIGLVILQSRSPTCGVNRIYDGSFTGKLIPGRGIFARALIEKGYRVIDAEDIMS
jgi:uncharacterized protein YbbK (DUF523 family)